MITEERTRDLDKTHVQVQAYYFLIFFLGFFRLLCNAF